MVISSSSMADVTIDSGSLTVSFQKDPITIKIDNNKITKESLKAAVAEALKRKVGTFKLEVQAENIDDLSDSELRNRLEQTKDRIDFMQLN